MIEGGSLDKKKSIDLRIDSLISLEENIFETNQTSSLWQTRLKSFNYRYAETKKIFFHKEFNGLKYQRTSEDLLKPCQYKPFLRSMS